MRRIPKYSDPFGEYFHPFWLGLIMLFTIITVIGMLCLIRKKYGSRLRCLCYRLLGKNELNNEHLTKSNKYSSEIRSFRRAPAFVPSTNSTPKLYKLVRSIPTISMDNDSFFQDIENHSTNNDISLNIYESNYVNQTRNCETARKFFASMRHTTQYPTSSSIESLNSEPNLSTGNQRKNSNRMEKFPTFHTSRFFQSITDA